MNVVKQQPPNTLLLYHNHELSFAKYWLYSVLIVWGFYAGILAVAFFDAKFCIRCQHCINNVYNIILNIKYIPFVAIALLLIYSIISKRINEIIIDANNKVVNLKYQKLFIKNYTINIPFQKFNYQSNFVEDKSENFDCNYWKLTLYNGISKIIEIKPEDLLLTNHSFENEILNPLNAMFRKS